MTITPMTPTPMSMSKDQIDLASDFAQFYSLYILLKDATNRQIMQELQHQNQDYLESISKRLENIEVNLEIINEHLGISSR